MRGSIFSLINYINLVIIGIAVIEASWIDPDTPDEHLTTIALTEDDDREYELVFSDEFEEDGRNMFDGTDPRWTSINKNDYTNAALHFYSSDNVRTSNGVLNITTEEKINYYRAFDEEKKQWYVDQKYIQTGMVQSWNKFCFMGGIVEFSAKLPGDPKKGGLWPALWMLGNLARATYVGSSNFVWPYSYNKCDVNNRKSQEINACARVNHYGLKPFTGRGSPEIDILETMQGESGKLPNTFIQRPYQSASLQIAPGVEFDRPVLGKRPHMEHWYADLEYSEYNHSDLNPFFYGVTLQHPEQKITYQSDALSANYQLNNTNYQKQHHYRVEWEPPNEEGVGGYIKWFTDGEQIYGIHGAALQELMGTEIPNEPMYLIMNTAVSSSWGFPTPCPDNCACKCYECGNPSCACALPSGYCDNFPAAFEIEYVRVWQAKNESKHVLGCSPESKPTENFIKGHSKRYMSAGQKQPLLGIRSGGGTCTKHSDCGKHHDMGQCTTAGLCSCSQNFTGPNCRSHNAFYDFDTSKEPVKVSLSEMIIPKSLFVIVIILILGFMGSLFGTVRAKAKSLGYSKVSDVTGVNGGTMPSSSSNTNKNESNTTSASYQDSGYQDSSAVHYALPPDHKKDVTYCVIDDRLVDDR